MTHSNNWFKLYKVLISKCPEYIRKIMKCRQIEHECGPRGCINLKNKQYNKLCKLAGESYTKWQQELSKRKENVRQAKEEFLKLFD